jgi:hypothetical protein
LYGAIFFYEISNVSYMKCSKLCKGTLNLLKPFTTEN